MRVEVCKSECRLSITYLMRIYLNHLRSIEISYQRNVWVCISMRLNVWVYYILRLPIINIILHIKYKSVTFFRWRLKLKSISFFLNNSFNLYLVLFFVFGVCCCWSPLLLSSVSFFGYILFYGFRSFFSFSVSLAYHWVLRAIFLLIRMCSTKDYTSLY